MQGMEKRIHWYKSDLRVHLTGNAWFFVDGTQIQSITLVVVEQGAMWERVRC